MTNIEQRARDGVRDIIMEALNRLIDEQRPAAIINETADAILAAFASPPTTGGDEADRQAAASTVNDDGSHVAYMMVDGILSGRMDDSPLVQAFRRHRLAALSPPSADGEEG